MKARALHKYATMEKLGMDARPIDVIDVLREWCRYYSVPKLIRLDAEGCHCSQALRDWCSSFGIELWIAPGEAHHLMGKVER